jgi:hypothetical protein
MLHRFSDASAAGAKNFHTRLNGNKQPIFI